MGLIAAEAVDINIFQKQSAVKFDIKIKYEV